MIQVKVAKVRVKRLVLLMSSSVVMAALLYLLLNAVTGEPFIRGERTGVYWLEVNQSTMFGMVLVSPCITFVVAALIPGFILRKGLMVERATIAVFLILMGIAFRLFLGPPIAGLQHIETVQSRKHVFYLAERIPIEGITLLPHACWERANDPDCIEAEFSHEYVVVRCGPLGLACQSVYFNAFDERINRSHGSLAVGPGTHSVSLRINDRLVWTYEIKE